MLDLKGWDILSLVLQKAKMKYKTKDRIRNGIELLLGYGVLAYIKLGDTTNQFIIDNIPDMIYPITNYAGIRAFCHVDKPSISLAVATSAVGIGFEIAQKYDLIPQTFSGTYDPKDIPCYIAGGVLAYGVDKLFYNKEKAES